MSKRKTTEEFINESNLKHAGEFDYSLVDYINSYTKVKIICKIHGIFEQIPSNHLYGQKCPKCFGKNKTTENLIIEFKKIHKNRYDYRLVKYINSKLKIKIICKEHGIFEQSVSCHLKGCNCPKCVGGIKHTKEQFIEKSIKIHKNKYNYSLVEYKNARTKVKIICEKHGIFEQVPQHHITGVGCPSCCESKGEKKLIEILEKFNIKYFREKRFKDCRYKNPLPFDFYLPKQNICIEYDGEQHFRKYQKFGGQNSLEKQKIKDSIKTNFCLENNIKLIRIKYDENIQEKLSLIF